MKRKHRFFSGKSLFLKYMNVSVIIVFLSFLVLGVILTMTISGYWYNEKHTTLARRADSIAEYIQTNIRSGYHPSSDHVQFEWINSDYAKYMGDFLHVYAGDVDSDIIIVDNNSHVRLSVSENPRLSEGVAVKSDSIENDATALIR